MSKTKSSNKDDNKSKLNLNSLTLPKYVSHLKPGNTFCTNENLLIMQNGSTTIEIRKSPKFQAKQVEWHEGLLRDIVWCSELGVFIFLKKNALFTFNPNSIAGLSETPTTANTMLEMKSVSYSKIKPYDDNSYFWRCTCIGKTLYICYSGFGTVIDQYILQPTSCKFVNRWEPPQTCAMHEGIWCIRSHPNTNQLGMTIMDARNNAWRFEVRSANNLSPMLQFMLPITHGDCEVSPLANNEWLIINSCGVRFIQIGDSQLKVMVEYERELRNAIVIGNNYFAVRTKCTMEIHSLKKKK